MRFRQKCSYPRKLSGTCVTFYRNASVFLSLQMYVCARACACAHVSLYWHCRRFSKKGNEGKEKVLYLVMGFYKRLSEVPTGYCSHGNIVFLLTLFSTPKCVQHTTVYGPCNHLGRQSAKFGQKTAITWLADIFRCKKERALNI